MELLQISSDQLVEAFSEIVEDKFDFICQRYGLDNEVSDSTG